MATEDFRGQLIKAASGRDIPSPKAGESVIEIHGPIRHLTALYERFRTLLDYQEERFIRRLAIRRILYRHILIQGERKAIAEPLLRELIRAAYVENGKYPQSVAEQINELLEKYLTALPTIEQRYPPPDLIRAERRLLGIAAAEIEALLSPPEVDLILADRLSADIATYLDTPIDDEIRIIALRSFLKADSDLITWRLCHVADSDAHTTWQEFIKKPATGVSDLLRMSAKYDALLGNREIEAKVRRFARLIPPYLILTDLAYQQPKRLEALASHQSDKLETSLESLVHERLTKTEAKVQRSIWRATIYIFITKVLFGVALEVPYDLRLLGHIAYVPLAINLLMPPILMFLAGLGIRTPSTANTELLVKRAKLLFLGGQLPPLADVETPHRRTVFAHVFFLLFYFATYVVSFGGLVWLLAFLGFNPVSILIFLFFLSVVGFFAFRIRSSANELAVLREREGLTLLIFDFFALPFLRVGRWLSVTIRQINIILFVLDFLIEAPLKVVFVAIEDWFTFLREKREELS